MKEITIRCYGVGIGDKATGTADFKAVGFRGAKEVEEHIRKSFNSHDDLPALLQEGSDIVSGMEAACDNAGIDTSEAREWWQKVDSLLKAIQL